MIKCFLSHSSRDKINYVHIVARSIRKEATVFCDETFEEGMSPLEEILNGLEESSLFVLFISASALESEWVKTELASAKLRLDDSKLDRIYPIIIEPGLAHNDARIPEWMQAAFNLQPILRPVIAARKINARLMELSWKYHPRLKERQRIFVGRNEQIQSIEERLDDFSQTTPIALIASGLPSIGRKALIQHALRKANLVRDSYHFPLVSLNQFDGIEDFILKTIDTGLVSVSRLRQRLAGTLAVKVELAKEVFHQIAAECDRVLIEDRGVLVQNNGEPVDWFIEVVESLVPNGHLTFAVASQFRPHPAINRRRPAFFSLAVKEMEPAERNGLLQRYAKFHNLDLAREEYNFFSDLLTGYPEQALFAVDLILENGITGAKRQSHVIQQFASDKARVVLDVYHPDIEIQSFIYLLSKFEFISYDVLFDIVNEKTYAPILNKLLLTSVCERMGAGSDYVRVNEVIRDYVSRNRFEIPAEFQAAIDAHVKKFVANYSDDSSDVSDYIFSAQESLRSGEKFTDDLLLPSVFVKTIKRLYDEDRNYKEVVTLSDRVLRREGSLHTNTIHHIRYIKCQALARLRQGAFFAEVKLLAEPDKSFLHGFYYRLAGEYAKAEESLNRVLNMGRRDVRVVGELVLVYMQSDEYERAFNLAKENWRSRPSNPINANNYLACLFAKDKTAENRCEIELVLSRLMIDQSERAQEMREAAQARVMAYFDNDQGASLALVEETIERFPNIDYPLLTKADLAAHFRNKVKLREAVERLERMTSRNAQTFRSFIKYKALLLAMEGKLYEAKQLVQKELRGLIGTAQRRLLERLDAVASS
ncbi:MAG: toll/interleukin-1 receptor domain-containing protein [Candidatus Accumulibacter sp. UW20]|jgi:hypothetical protein